MDVQKSYLDQLKQLAENDGLPLPIFCAGDIFDRWGPPPELLSFALTHLPFMYSVPGQHDLPNHRIEQMHRSAYGVLVKAKKLFDISGQSVLVEGIMAHGFGWGQEIKPMSQFTTKQRVHLAVVHQYVWTGTHSYPGAPEENEVTHLKKKLKGFDAAVFGDNHKGFLGRVGECSVINCGGFIRRKSDEISYRPMVGVLMSDGSIKRHRLDTSHDKFHEKEETPSEVGLDMEKFLEELEGLGEHGLNFKEAVERHLRKEKLKPEVEEIIRQALEAKLQ